MGVTFTTPRRLGVVAAALAFAIDQANKYWMIDIFDIAQRQPINVLPVLDIVMVWNKGVSYGRLRADTDLGRWLLLGFMLVVTGVFAVWMWKTPGRVGAAGLGLIVGAALANALDRFAHGAVADFYYFHTPFPLGPLSNYVFNLADVAIVAGVGLLLYETFLTGAQKTAKQAVPDEGAPDSP